MSAAPSVSTPVLIAGAGPAGLTLALTLMKNGIPVRIIDKSQEHHVGQRACGTMPRTHEVWNLLGVLPDIKAAATTPKPMRVYKLPEGREAVKEISLKGETDPTPAIPYWHMLIIGQEHTEAILRSHLAKLGCHVELGAELISFEQHPDHVIAQVRKVQDSSIETVTCHWLVGTDGARGVVRKLLGLTFLGETYEDHQMLLADLHLTGVDREHWHRWYNVSDKFLLIRPTEYNDDSFSLVGPADGLDIAKITEDPEELAAYIRANTGRDDIEVGKIKWISQYRPNVRMVNKFGEGRVFVAGDAAHVHSPAGGQGMNSSIQDSFNLGWKLALVEKGLALPALLSSYTDERLPVIAKMLNISTNLFDKVVAADESAWDRGGQLLQLGIHYRWSPVVLDERAEPGDSPASANPYGVAGDAIRAGDRAPDAPGLLKVKGPDALDTTTSLFRIFGPSYHTALIFGFPGQVPQAVLAALKRCPAEVLRTALITPKDGAAPLTADVELVVSDQDGHAYTGYGVGSDNMAAVIVRPDGVIGGYLQSAEGIGRYFERVFGTSV
ncbi:monooxygenase [Obba rivulosa]|uniref:Monooxygenase n=1 Tax=Obba rivulosa TaxID=1052685 RepID=A0A8E2AQR8_9APHY|nr:monooxygenase [Obba rivulosa]